MGDFVNYFFLFYFASAHDIDYLRFLGETLQLWGWGELGERLVPMESSGYGSKTMQLLSGLDHISDVS